MPKCGLLLALSVVFLLAVPQDRSQCQVQFSIPVTAKDNVPRVGTMYFGLQPGATFCTDPALGEAELPPWPPEGPMEARFMNPLGEDDGCFGLGRLRDYRPFIDTGQTDRFWIRFEGNYPFTFSWPNLSPYYRGEVRMVDVVTDGMIVNVDMKAVDSVVIVQEGIRDVLITAHGPVGPEPPPPPAVPSMNLLGFLILVLLVALSAVLLMLLTSRPSVTRGS